MLLFARDPEAYCDWSIIEKGKEIVRKAILEVI
jgi:hypothetical protein